MKTKILINMTLIVLLLTPISANEIQSKTEEILQAQFGKDINISYEKYNIDENLKRRIENQCSQKFFDDNIYLWRINSNDSLLAIALMDNVYGKTLPITFLVIFDLDGSIQSTHIIKYREDHGGAVSSESWNKQFMEKDGKSKFKVGDDIHGISGATISVSSVTKGIQKLTLLFEEIMKGYNASL